MSLVALPELQQLGTVLPESSYSKTGGEGRVRTFEGLRRQIYSLIHLATLVPHRIPELGALRRQSKIEATQDSSLT